MGYVPDITMDKLMDVVADTIHPFIDFGRKLDRTWLLTFSIQGSTPVIDGAASSYEALLLALLEVGKRKDCANR